MPGKARVHELAKELGMDSKTVLSWLKDNGEFVKSASSTVEAPVARKLREAFPARRPARPSSRPRPPRPSLPRRLPWPGRRLLSPPRPSP